MKTLALLIPLVAPPQQARPVDPPFNTVPTIYGVDQTDPPGLCYFWRSRQGEPQGLGFSGYFYTGYEWDFMPALFACSLSDGPAFRFMNQMIPLGQDVVFRNTLHATSPGDPFGCPGGGGFAPVFVQFPPVNDPALHGARLYAAAVVWDPQTRRSEIGFPSEPWILRYCP